MVDNLGHIIASQIIKARLRLGWTQSELAKRTSITKSVLYRYENGEREAAAPGNLMKIADATGVTLDFLVGRDGIQYRLRQARLKNKMTQQQLADILDVPVSDVRKWESYSEPDIDKSRIPDIARATGVPVNYLMGGFF